MKALKNFEGLFLAIAALTVVASYANAAAASVRYTQPAAVTVAAADASLPTVVVHAKRLTAAEKANLG